MLRYSRLYISSKPKTRLPLSSAKLPTTIDSLSLSSY